MHASRRFKAVVGHGVWFLFQKIAQFVVLYAFCTNAAAKLVLLVERQPEIEPGHSICNQRYAQAWSIQSCQAVLAASARTSGHVL